jgi:hypothetical protein
VIFETIVLVLSFSSIDVYLIIFYQLQYSRPTVCVRGLVALARTVDFAWEQKKLEATESPASSVLSS